MRTLALLLFVLWTAEAAAAPYQLAHGDRVDVRVFDRSDLSASARVDVNGDLRLPLIGAVPAAGRTADEVERTLEEAYRGRAGILEPRVSVAIIETGPIFVAGFVQTPGRYAWEVGLTALKAYAQAGGAPRQVDGNALLVLEAYRAIEAEQQAAVRLAGTRLRRARLVAEATFAPSFPEPEGWAEGLSPEEARGLAERETELFTRRRAALEGELSVLARQLDILSEQAAAFRAAAGKKAQQEALLHEEFKALDTPEGRRLVPVPRLLSLRRSIVEVEGDQRDIERRIAETRLQEATIDQTSLNLRNARAIEASNQLAEIERDLIVLREGANLARRRADAARAFVGPSLGRPLDDRRKGADALPTFVIRREVDGALRSIPAEGDAPLRPRDLLLVQ